VEESPPIELLEERIGRRFVDRGLLERALIHRSWAHDRNPPLPDNERLEFLGDAVVGLVVAERLFEEFGDDEGRLTRARAGLVQREALAEHARSLELGRWLKLGRGELGQGGRDNDSILADAFEALVGAIYRDGDLAAAREFIGQVMAPAFDRRGTDGGIHSPRDARTRLQERLQRAGKGTPRYRDVGCDGPPHAPVWTVEVMLSGEALSAGTGRNKAQAGQEAARLALEALERADSDDGAPA
jgi:ribonuclease III